MARRNYFIILLIAAAFCTPSGGWAQLPAPQDLTTCQTNLSTCEGNLATCVGDLATESSALTNCSKELTQCQEQEQTCQTTNNTYVTQISDCQDNSAALQANIAAMQTALDAFAACVKLTKKVTKKGKVKYKAKKFIGLINRTCNKNPKKVGQKASNALTKCLINSGLITYFSNL